MRGAFSLLDSEITKVHTPTGDVKKGESLAYAPELQFNVSARYEWNTEAGHTAHGMPQLIYSDGSSSDIIEMNRDELEDYVVANVTMGVTADQWSAELFIDNITDERAETGRNFVNDVQRASIMRPLTIGLRTTFNY